MSAKVAWLGALVFLTLSCGTRAKPAAPEGGQADAMIVADAPSNAPTDATSDAPEASAQPADSNPDSPEPSDDAPAGSGDGPVDLNAAEVGPADAAGGAPGGAGGLGGAGTGGLGGSGEDGGASDSGSECTAPVGQYGPFPGCSSPPPDNGCDLVCQSGCACNERCKVVNGTPGCQAEGPSFLQQYETCEPRDDRCRPGTICLQDSVDQPSCGAHCYRHCHADADCPSSRCNIDIQFGSASTIHKVCSPPVDPCSPIGPARCSAGANRPSPSFGCYTMSADDPDLTICDCAGPLAIGMSCTYRHECQPGAECVLSGMVRLCRRVCGVGLPAGTPVAMGGCPVLNPTCTAFPGGALFGYCH
jgi:hypothetical protein